MVGHGQFLPATPVVLDSWMTHAQPRDDASATWNSPGCWELVRPALQTRPEPGTQHRTWTGQGLKGQTNRSLA